MTKLEKIPISVLVQTKNEAQSIARCISALADFAQVIVVDSYSDDGTQDIARQAGAEVVLFKWNGAYPKKKQWQLENLATKHEWILFVDADETPTQELIDELRVLFDGEADRLVNVAAFDLSLDYVFAGRHLRYGHRVVKRALVRRGGVKFPEISDIGAPGMGELEGHYQPLASGAVKTLRARMRHEDRDPIATWFERHNRYSDWEAYLRVSPNARKEAAALRSRQGQLFDRLPMKPVAFFAYSYVFRAGFRDGRAGLDYALALASYYWQIGLKVREREGWNH